MGKTLLVYYSLTGLNQTIANLIHDKFQIDTFNLKSEVNYPKSMYPCWEIVRHWRGVAAIPNHGEPLPNMNDLPGGISNQLPDISNYDNIIIGGPVWGWTLSDPIMAFLNKADLADKNIKAYWTCVDTDYNYQDNLQQMLPNNSNFVAGLNINSGISGNRDELEQSLNGLIGKW